MEVAVAIGTDPMEVAAAIGTDPGAALRAISTLAKTASARVGTLMQSAWNWKQTRTSATTAGRAALGRMRRGWTIKNGKHVMIKWNTSNKPILTTGTKLAAAAKTSTTSPSAELLEMRALAKSLAATNVTQQRQLTTVLAQLKAAKPD